MTNPDVSLAAERTALSWERSALAFVVLGVLAVRVAASGGVLALGVGSALLLVAAAAAAARTGVGQHEPPSRATIAAVALATVVASPLSAALIIARH